MNSLSSKWRIFLYIPYICHKPPWNERKTSLMLLWNLSQVWASLIYESLTRQLCNYTYMLKLHGSLICKVYMCVKCVKRNSFHVDGDHHWTVSSPAIIRPLHELSHHREIFIEFLEGTDYIWHETEAECRQVSCGKSNVLALGIQISKPKFLYSACLQMRVA